jgi:FPC/CPF motif-containing protein YcgG
LPCHWNPRLSLALSLYLYLSPSFMCGVWCDCFPQKNIYASLNEWVMSVLHSTFSTHHRWKATEIHLLKRKNFYCLYTTDPMICFCFKHSTSMKHASNCFVSVDMVFVCFE